jgi:2-dehydro-3-deoxygluconokinase
LSLLTMQATSAESNVASIPAYLGLRVKILTTFVKDSPIARFIKDDLASRHIDYEGKEVDQGGPWGYRHQFNLADSGYGSRGPRVSNDRAGEVGRTLNVKDFDLDRIFGRSADRAPVGTHRRLSPDTGTFCLELAQAAKVRHADRGDLNYAPSGRAGKELQASSTRSRPSPTSSSATRKTSSFRWASKVPRRAARAWRARSTASKS